MAMRHATEMLPIESSKICSPTTDLLTRHLYSRLISLDESNLANLESSDVQQYARLVKDSFCRQLIFLELCVCDARSQPPRPRPSTIL